MTEYIKKTINQLTRSREVRASTAYMICSILQKCLSVLTLPLFTRLLTTEEYGVSTVYASTMAIVTICTTLYLPYGSFSTAMVKFEKDREGYISSANTICVFLTCFFFVVYFSFSSFWNNILKLPIQLIVLMGFEVLFNTAILFWMGKARYEYRYKSFVAITLLTSVLGTGCSLLAVVYLPNKGVTKIIANGIVISIIGLIIMIRSVIVGRQCFNKEYWKYALSFNIILIPYYLSQLIFNQSDSIMINYMLGKSSAALYGVAYNLAFILTFVLNAINNSFVPWMYRKIKENKLQEHKQVSVILAALMSVLLLGIISLAPEIILVMAGEQYSSAVWVVPPVAMSLLLLFYSQLFINIEFYYEEKYKLVVASILSPVVNVVLNYYFIQRFGYIAAGYTTLISYLLFAGCNYFAMRKICKERSIKGELFDVRMLLVILLVFFIVSMVFMVLYPYRLVRLGVIAIGLIAVVAFHKKVIGFTIRLMNTIKS